MSERLPIEKSELEKPGEVFDAIAALRVGAQAQRAAYRQTVSEMNELCTQLKGVELLLTGWLETRGGIRMYTNDPLSQVERMHVRISDAAIVTDEREPGVFREHLPFVRITAWTLADNELIVARLGAGDQGVSAETVESTAVQT